MDDGIIVELIDEVELLVVVVMLVVVDVIGNGAAGGVGKKTIG